MHCTGSSTLTTSTTPCSNMTPRVWMAYTWPYRKGSTTHSNISLTLGSVTTGSLRLLHCHLQAVSQTGTSPCQQQIQQGTTSGSGVSTATASGLHSENRTEPAGVSKSQPQAGGSTVVTDTICVTTACIWHGEPRHRPTLSWTTYTACRISPTLQQ